MEYYILKTLTLDARTVFHWFSSETEVPVDSCLSHSLMDTGQPFYTENYLPQHSLQKTAPEHCHGW